MAAKKKKDPRFEPITASSDSLHQAIMALEKSEAPFYQGMQSLRDAERELKTILANVNFYHHAARALGTIAVRDCHFKDAKRTVCSEHTEDRTQWCEPCYALHVISGGTP